MDITKTLAARLRNRAENNLGEIYTAADRELDTAAADRLSAPDVGVGLTRWSVLANMDHQYGGTCIEPVEDPDGDWVLHEDVAPLLAAARAVPADVKLEPIENESEYRRWGGLKPLFRNYDTLTAALAASTAREKVKDAEIAELREVLAGEPTTAMVEVGTKARWRSPVRDANNVREIWRAMTTALSGRKPDTKEGT